MSLLPPSLSSPAPVPSGSVSSTVSARGDDSPQGDSESFGEVLSRSLAASGEAPAKLGGKPAAPVPAKRLADDKTEAADIVNTAALLFVPLETRIAKAANSDSGTAAPGGAMASALGTPPSAELPAAPTASTAAAASSDAAPVGDEPTPVPQALLASGATAAAAVPTKGRESSEPTAPSAASDKTAAALPAGSITIPAGAAQENASQASSGQGQRPSDEAREVLGMDTRAEQKPAAAKAPATTAAKDAAAETAGSATQALAPGASQPENAAPTASPGISLSTTAPTVHTQAAPAIPAAAAAPGQPVLTPEVGSDEWGQALGRQMLHMGKAGEQVAELQLNPPGLGPLKVTLSMNDNQVQALFVSAHSSVRAAVEAALPQLRSTLADSGISLGNTSVDSGGQQQAAFAQTHQGQNGRPGPSGQPGYLPADAQAQSPAATAPTPRRGKVDTYA
ncbi:flagellar hook-length control protein FliK [Polaromonas sp. JS666]|uniref:flagellar hook-length control protein FliK n=1 Tax=Polaromonas sp. (strain JS666 / ATCC BAA-500) TaxID=296591 RepID=UPI00088C7D45|nr:flagellar hook-length control protein FliK [Polaromonas sp. JS666]SDN42422.1 flagellar hook-length control protein FliK [Polaromonas sp. JS666]